MKKFLSIILSVFFKWFLKQLPKNIMYVEAFANKKNLKHFFDVLCSNRYDEEDMIILREKDFEA